MRVSITFLFLLLLAKVSLAQPDVNAMKYFEMKQYNRAKAFFVKSLEIKNTASDLFYLGKIYSLQGKQDSAEIFFNRISVADPKSSFTLVAQAISEISSGKNSQARFTLEKAQKMAMAAKDVGSLVEIARYRYLSGDTIGWMNPLDFAISTDSKNIKPYLAAAEIYLLAGEREQKSNQFIGLASGRFEQALYIEPENPVALTGQAGIFIIGGNFREAAESLDKVILKDSNYIPALLMYGEMAYSTGKYEKASLLYGRYMALAEYSEKELIRYITILFFNREYAKSHELIKSVLHKYPSNAVLLRLKGYTSYELGKYPEGLDAMKKFFDLRSANGSDKIIATDFEYTGRLYSQSGDDSLSIVYLKKAFEMDTSQTGLLEDIAKSFEKLKNYTQAVDYYNKFVQARKGNSSSATYFNLGKDLLIIANESAAKGDSASKLAYLNRSVTAFGKVIELSPNSYLGYHWRARALAALDPETTQGLAKTDYETALSIMDQKADPSKYKSDRIEVYRYLGYFYYQLFDSASILNNVKAADEAKASSLKNWQQVLVLDPENEIAKQAVKALK